MRDIRTASEQGIPSQMCPVFSCPNSGVPPCPYRPIKQIHSFQRQSQAHSTSKSFPFPTPSGDPVSIILTPSTAPNPQSSFPSSSSSSSTATSSASPPYSPSSSPSSPSPCSRLLLLVLCLLLGFGLLAPTPTLRDRLGLWLRLFVTSDPVSRFPFFWYFLRLGDEERGLDFVDRGDVWVCD